MASNLVSAAPDGVTPGNSDVGWTPQSAKFNSNKTLESSTGQGSFGMGDASGQGYLAWSMDPTDAQTIGTIGSTATSFGWLTRVFCSDTGTTTNLDLITATGTPATITGCVFALYSGPGFATGPMAFTASVTATTLTASNTLFSIPWTAPVFLQSMQYYWIYTTCTFSSTGTLTLVSNSSINAVAQNANMTATAASANASMTLSPAPVLFGAMSSSSTLTPQTSWANSANRFFFGLR
jgi:hypothetical protein